MENWVHDPRVLHRLARHYTYGNEGYLKTWHANNKTKRRLPPEKPPSDLFDAITLKRHPANQLSNYLKLIWMSKFDMIMHSYTEEELRTQDLALDCHKILKESYGVYSIGNRNDQYLSWEPLKDYPTCKCLCSY